MTNRRLLQALCRYLRGTGVQCRDYAVGRRRRDGVDQANWVAFTLENPTPQRVQLCLDADGFRLVRYSTDSSNFDEGCGASRQVTKLELVDPDLLEKLVGLVATPAVFEQSA